MGSLWEDWGKGVIKPFQGLAGGHHRFSCIRFGRHVPLIRVSIFNRIRHEYRSAISHFSASLFEGYDLFQNKKQAVSHGISFDMRLLKKPGVQPAGFYLLLAC